MCGRKILRKKYQRSQIFLDEKNSLVPRKHWFEVYQGLQSCLRDYLVQHHFQVGYCIKGPNFFSVVSHSCITHRKIGYDSSTGAQQDVREQKDRMCQISVTDCVHLWELPSSAILRTVISSDRSVARLKIMIGPFWTKTGPETAHPDCL